MISNIPKYAFSILRKGIKITALSLISSIGIHYYLANNFPQFSSKYLKTMLNSQILNDNIEFKIKIIHLLLSYKMFPRLSISEEDLNKLNINIFNKKIRLGFGLGCNFDCHSSYIKELETKCFLDYIESGTSVIEEEVSKNYETKVVNKNQLVVKNIENKYSLITFNFLNLENYLKDKVKSQSYDTPILGINIKSPFNSSKLNPYLIDLFLSKSIKDIINVVDYVSVDLSNSKNIAERKYDDPQNLKKLITQLQTIINKNSVENNIGSKRLLIKLDLTKLVNYVKNEKELFKILDVLNTSGVSALVLESSVSLINNETLFNSPNNKEKMEKNLELINKYKSQLKNSTKFKVIVNDAVTEGKDIVNYYKKGADLVLVSTLFLLEGPYCIERLVKEINSIYL